jgi:DNA-binding SARP family transcriptional activator/Tfp pilus assembly protein PilF
VSGEVVLRVLGPVAARRGAGWLGGPPQQRLVLGVLGLQAGHVVPAGELVDAVWGEGPPRSAQASIQALVTGVRRVLAGVPGARVERCGDGYRLRMEPGVVDVHRFRSLARAGRGAGEGLAAVAAFDESLALWRGPALADVPGTARVEAIRAGLAGERLAVMQDRAGALLGVGRHAEAAGELASLLAAHPLAEGVAGMLMVALQRCGRQADALAVFRDMRRRLSGELAVEPGPQLQRLHQKILAGEPALAGDPAVAGAAWMAAGAEHSAAGAGPLVVPRQLPGAVPHFAGRAAEQEALSGLLGRAGGAGETVVVSAIGGTAGVGKTALAVHWAHQAAGSFPDGQLYVNLRAFGPSGRPVTAAEALRGFLEAVGVPPSRVPAGVTDRAALYRSMLAGRRMLVVLDNAGDEEQVRPLLPGSAGCLVVVTSRRSLAGLAAAEGALLLALDVLSEAEAAQLLAARLGAGRAAAEPRAVGELAALCARLPLALAVAAVRAAASPDLGLGSLAAQLRDLRGRLDMLDGEDRASSVRAVLSWSYQKLSGSAARMFRLLGIHPGPDISLAAAASLAGVPRDQARRALAELTDAHLLAEHAAGRWVFHDLLRAYAMERAEAEEDPEQRRAATGRTLDHYLRTAWRAALLLRPDRDPSFILAPPQRGADPETIRDGDHALVWCQAEYQVLLAVSTQAESEGFDAHAWQLPWALTDYLARTGLGREVASTLHTALAAAQRLGDLAGQARAHQALGCPQLRCTPTQARNVHLDQALSLYQELGDQIGQAWTHFGFGQALEQQGQTGAALGHARLALSLARAAGYRGAEAVALNMIGWLHAQLGNFRSALRCCERALALHRATGDRHGEAATCDSLGYISHQLGDHAQATAYYQQALRLSRQAGCRPSQAEILDHLGDTRDAAGDPQAALDTWRQALAVFHDLHHPAARQLRRKLRDHETRHPALAATMLLRAPQSRPAVAGRGPAVLP